MSTQSSRETSRGNESGAEGSRTIVWDCEFCGKAFDTKEGCIRHESACSYRTQTQEQSQTTERLEQTIDNENQTESSKPSAATEPAARNTMNNNNDDQDDESSSSSSSSSSSWSSAPVLDTAGIVSYGDLNESPSPVPELRASTTGDPVLFDLDQEDPVLRPAERQQSLQQEQQKAKKVAQKQPQQQEDKATAQQRQEEQVTQKQSVDPPMQQPALKETGATIQQQQQEQTGHMAQKPAPRPRAQQQHPQQEIEATAEQQEKAGPKKQPAHPPVRQQVAQKQQSQAKTQPQLVVPQRMSKEQAQNELSACRGRKQARQAAAAEAEIQVQQTGEENVVRQQAHDSAVNHQLPSQQAATKVAQSVSNEKGDSLENNSTRSVGSKSKARADSGYQTTDGLERKKDQDPSGQKRGSRSSSEEEVSVLNESEKEIIEVATKTWDEMYELLVEYRKKVGHCKIRSDDKSELATWVRYQQSDLSKKLECGELDACDGRRIRLLREIQFDWPERVNFPPEPSSVPSPSEDQWTKMFAEVSNFKREKNRLPTEDDNKRLFDWICRQVVALGKKQLDVVVSEREAIRISHLIKLGVSWSEKFGLVPEDVQEENDDEPEDGMDGASDTENDESNSVEIETSKSVSPSVESDHDTDNSSNSGVAEDSSMSDELPRGIIDRKQPRPLSPLGLEEFFSIEDRLKEAYNTSIIEAEEAHIQQLTKDLCAEAGEDWFLAETYRDIAEATRRAVGQVKEVSFWSTSCPQAMKRPLARKPGWFRRRDLELVTEDYWMEEEAPQKRRRRLAPQSKGPQEVYEPASFSKIVPKRLWGRSLFSNKDRKMLCSLPFCGHHLVENDHDTFRLQVFYQDGYRLDDCYKAFGDWLSALVNRLRVSVIKEHPVRSLVNVNMSPALKVIQVDNNVLLHASQKLADSCPVKELREGLRSSGVLVMKVDGKPCHSVDAFQKLMATSCTEMVRLEILSTTGVSNVGNQKMPEPDGSSGISASNSTSHSVHQAGDRENDSDGGFDFPEDESYSDVRKGGDSFSGKRANESRSHREAATAHYDHFRAKYSAVAEIEFKGTGIHQYTALSRMWALHKEMFGSSCNETCPCALKVHVLSKDIVDTQLLNSRWQNPLRLKSGQMPVGFAGNFWSSFAEKLKEEKPLSRVIPLLCTMWEQHQSNSCYGMKCSKNCRCIEAWETFFDPNREQTNPRKRQRLGRVRGRTASHSGKHVPAQNRAENPGNTAHRTANRLLNVNKTRVAYGVVFQGLKPMGCAFHDSNDSCRVKSIWKVPDQRIHVGTTVVGFAPNAEYDGNWIPIKSCAELKQHYKSFQGKEFTCYFKNLQQSFNDPIEEKKFLKFDTELWTKNGKWKGSKHQGWPGGAWLWKKPRPRESSVARNVSDNSHSNNRPLEDHNRLPQIDGAPTAQDSASSKSSGADESSSKCDGTEEDEWMTFSTPLTTPTKIAPPILGQPVNKSRGPKSIEFSLTNEVRKFFPDANSNEFLVLRNTLPRTSPQARLRQVVEKGTFQGLIKLLCEERLAFGMSVDALTDMSKLLDKKSGGAKDRDAKMKGIILKIFRRVGDTFNRSAFIHQSLYFRIVIDMISMKDAVKQGEQLWITLRSRKSQAVDTPTDSLSFKAEESFTFPPSSQPAGGFVFQVNTHQHPDTLLVFEIQRQNPSTGKKEIIGRGESSFRELLSQLSGNDVRKHFSTRIAYTGKRDKQFGSCTCSYSVLDCSSDEKKISQDRKKYGSWLNQAIEWIETFNRDLQPGEPPLSPEIPVMGQTSITLAIIIACEQLTSKLVHLGIAVKKDVLEFAVQQSRLISDKYESNRHEICRILRNAAEQQRNEPKSRNSGAPRPNDLIMQEPQFVAVRDWLFSHVQSRQYNQRCSSFETGGFCSMGATCRHGHVLKPKARHPLWIVSKKFKKELVITLPLRDDMGTEYFTAGYIDSNDFFYAAGKGGILCQATGIYWWRTENQARSAVEDVVSEYYHMT